MREKEKRSYITKIIFVQVIVCGLIVLSVLMLSKVSTEKFESLRAFYNEKICVDLYSDTVSAALVSVKDYLLHPSEATTENETAATSETTAETTTEELTGSGGEDIDSAAENTTDSIPLTTEKSFTVPLKGKVTSPFGERVHPITGKNSFHTGIDIGAAIGVRFACAYDGTVESVGQNENAGNYILMNHGDGLQTYYCHCSEILVEEGAVIRSGEIIGLVGETGKTTGPHLHFEIRRDGKRYDPASVMSFNDVSV